MDIHAPLSTEGRSQRDARTVHQSESEETTMAHGKTDKEIINKTHNTARFFVEVRQISWVLLIGALLWGFYSYFSMPQRKDPEVAVRQAVAITAWPGASAEKIEQLVTKKIEEHMAAN